MQAYAGLMSITGEDETRPPIRDPLATIDMGSGLWAAVGILARLIEREKTGHGGLVETSLLKTALAFATIPLASMTIAPRQMKPTGPSTPGIVPYQAFRASDGWIVIAAGNDGLFGKLAHALDRAELATDERFVTNAARVQHISTLIPLLEAEIATHTIAQVRERLVECGVPNAPVERIDQVLQDPQTQALGIVQQGPAGASPTLCLPLRFDGVRSAY